MAKYLCSYEKVKELGQKTIDKALAMKEDTTKFDEKINKELLGDIEMFTGKSRDAFDDRLHNENGLINGAKDISEFENKLGIHVITAAGAIKSLDGKLAKLKI